MAQKKQEAIVDSKKSTLIIYSTTEANKSNKISKVKKGTKVTITRTKTVQGTTWAYIKGAGIEAGWVIMQAAGSTKSNLDTTSTEKISIDPAKTVTLEIKSTVKSDIKTFSTDTVQETTGVVRQFGVQSNTGEVTRTIEPFADFVNKKNIYEANAANEQKKNFSSISYEILYDTNIQANLEKMRRSINLDTTFSSEGLMRQYANYYNRFKLPQVDDVLDRTFAHVFFTRPDLNIMTYSGAGTYKIAANVKGRNPYENGFINHLECMKQLISCSEYTHDFSLYLSNRVENFESSDRQLDTDSYGKSLRGYSISYGKHMDHAKAAGSLSFTFTEDKFLSVYNLHNVWVSYISDAYTGKIAPQYWRIIDKELDYACSIYFIVTDATGENIIYWSKYYGCYPTSIPDGNFSWQKGEIKANTSITIPYNYSFREDCNVDTLYELNKNTGTSDWKYARTYEPDLLGTGTTWVGAPFVEMVKNGHKTEYKLRFLDKK